jgi:hypothetical protein
MAADIAAMPIRATTSITVGHAELDDLHAVAAELSAGQPQTLTLRQALRWLLDNRPSTTGRATAIEGI